MIDFMTLDDFIDNTLDDTLDDSLHDFLHDSLDDSLDQSLGKTSSINMVNFQPMFLVRQCQFDKQMETI